MLKLRYSTTSPFVRKASITILECGLENQVERIVTNPWAPDTDLPHTNPLGKVPALTIENGQVLFDSPVICEYLDSLSSLPCLFPREGEARWIALRRQALGDGVLEAAVGRLLEGRRPAEQQSEAVANRYQAAITRALDAFEQDSPSFAGGFDIGHITVVTALEYLEFRFSQDDWRAGRPQLKRWYDSIAERDSVKQTVPYE